MNIRIRLILQLLVLAAITGGCSLFQGSRPADPAPAAPATGIANTSTEAAGPTPTEIPASPTPRWTATHTAEPTIDLTGFGECPLEDKAAVLDLSGSDLVEVDHADIMLTYLNAGGSPNKLIERYRNAYRWADKRHLHAHDLSGDGVSEVVFLEVSDRVDVLIFVCRNGLFEAHEATSFGFETDPRETPRPADGGIEVMRDLDHDDIHDLVLVLGDDRELKVEVLQWADYHFKSVTRAAESEDPACVTMYGPSDLDVEDVDQDRVFELVLEQEIPIDLELLEGLPWRRETRTCFWNGTYFELGRVDFSRATYRFQAVQDGDRFFLYGEYERALQAYQNGYIQNQLEWYSQQRKFQLTQVTLQSLSEFDLTPAPPPEEDLAEYSFLAAYSRFRIVVLYLVIERLFWDGYQNTNSLAEGCRLAVQFVDIRPDLLVHIGAGHHGWQSPVYEASDICPISGG